MSKLAQQLYTGTGFELGIPFAFGTDDFFTNVMRSFSCPVVL
ncbi:hypothetical protein B4098_3382 [Heyndrickxia coagulans]|uniref:Uncharacterized protein n=1 Tax=Heyndrickxia coagulans TaxID=1398 RepID=A0A150K531_HEYCO|nr:hypothetical protein B4098_3382 [Heyndrickxia coagulans]